MVSDKIKAWTTDSHGFVARNNAPTNDLPRGHLMHQFVFATLRFLAHKMPAFRRLSAMTSDVCVPQNYHISAAA